MKVSYSFLKMCLLKRKCIYTAFFFRTQLFGQENMLRKTNLFTTTKAREEKCFHGT